MAKEPNVLKISHEMIRAASEGFDGMPREILVPDDPASVRANAIDDAFMGSVEFLYKPTGFVDINLVSHSLESFNPAAEGLKGSLLVSLVGNFTEKVEDLDISEESKVTVKLAPKV